MTDDLHPPAVDRTLLAGAAVASGAAGLIHAAAAGSHSGDRTLVLLFAVCAAAQAGWAGLVALRPTRLVALAGVALNGVALLAWVGSRTTGLPLVDALREAEDVGFQDLAAAAFALLAVALAALAVVRLGRTVSLSPLWSAGVLVLVGVLAVPAMAAEHEHEHDHGAGHDHGEDETAGHEHGEGEDAGDGHGHDGETAGHDHDDGEDAGDGHGEGREADHEHGEGEEGDHGAEDAAATAGGDGHEHHEIPDRLDHPPTADQEAAAQELIDETEAATTQYQDVQAATDAGYRSIGDGAGGFEHYVNPAYTADATVLDPSAPESLVYQVLPDGGRELSTVMYILAPGSTMDDVPDIAGNLTVWHLHDDLCFASGGRVAGRLVDGRCRPAGVHRTTPPMLHVWVVPNDCGPFAGVDRAQSTGSCVDGL
jgi:hypothetical protein